MTLLYDVDRDKDEVEDVIELSRLEQEDDTDARGFCFYVIDNKWLVSYILAYLFLCNTHIIRSMIYAYYLP